MGLGKSLIIVALVHTLLSQVKSGIKNVLLVAPKNVTSHWKNEFPKFTRGIPNVEKIKIAAIEDCEKNLREYEIGRWHETDHGILIVSFCVIFTCLSKTFRCPMKCSNCYVKKIKTSY